MCAFRLSSAALLAAALPLSANAADLGLAPLYSPARIYSWSGFYGGLNVGGAWSVASSKALSGPFIGETSEILYGVVGGGQVGYNWQLPSNIVVGIEGDFQATGESYRASSTTFGVTAAHKDTIPYFATVRGRLGYVMGNFMPYITGGWGYSQFRSTTTVTGLLNLSSSSSSWYSLWVVGAGVEAVLWNDWTWKIEYLCLDTGILTDSYRSGITIRSHAANNVVRVGLNYHFR